MLWYALSRTRRRCAGRVGPARGRVAALALGAGRCERRPGGAPEGARAAGAREAAPRRVYQQVKLTEEERDQLRARAAELGVSVPRLMVESALSGVETPTERRRMVAELFEARRLLATVANNVNQLAQVGEHLRAGERGPAAGADARRGRRARRRAAAADGGRAVIPNVTRGGKTHGVLLYLVGKGKREEHENPHLVAGSPEAVRMGEGQAARALATRSRWRGSWTSRARRSAPR